MSDLVLKWRELDEDAPGVEQWKKMISGELYNCMVPYLFNFRAEARRLIQHYNSAVGLQKDMVQRATLVGELFGSIGSNIIIEPPLRVDYGKNMFVGKNFYANFDCVFLDWYAMRSPWLRLRPNKPN